MKYFILILACLCAMSCSRQTTGIDAFVSQYDQASVRMPGILMPLVKKKLHKAGINVKSIKVLTPEKLQKIPPFSSVTSLIWKCWTLRTIPKW